MRPILPKKRASPGDDAPPPPPVPESSLPSLPGQQPEFRMPMNREPSASASVSSVGTSEAVKPKKIRNVISNACTACRRRRSKCDGMNPCGKCTSLDRPAECHYDAENDARRKGALRRENDELKRKNQCLTTILKTIATSEDADTERIIKRLKTGETFEDIVNNIRAADPARRDRKESYASSEDADKSSQGGREESPILNRPRPSNWTKVTNDDSFILELIELYFTWHHPFFNFFDEFKFREDFVSGSTDNCSSLLVNSVLTVGCHYCDRPEAHADPEKIDSKGEHFFEVAKEMLSNTHDRSLTYIQASLVLALRESTQGKDMWAWTHVALSSRMLNDASFNPLLVPEHEREDGTFDEQAWATTYWGAFNFEMLWYLAMKQHPGVEYPHRLSVPKPRLSKAQEESVWRPYDGQTYLQGTTIPSRNFEGLMQLIDLCTIVEDMNRWLYGKEPFKAEKLLGYYRRIKQWQASIPSQLRVSDDSDPLSFYLTELSYAVIVHLFHPFIKLPFPPATNFQSPKDITSTAAREGYVVLRQHGKKWGWRRVNGIFYQITMALATARQRDIPLPGAQEDYVLAIRSLTESAVAWKFAMLGVRAIRDMKNVPEKTKKPNKEIEKILEQVEEVSLEDTQQIKEDSPYFVHLVENEPLKDAAHIVSNWQTEWIKYSASLEESAPAAGAELLRKPSISSLLNH